MSQIVLSPDKDTFKKVSHLLSLNAVSVAASSGPRLTHVVTSLLSKKLRATLEELRVEIEDR